MKIRGSMRQNDSVMHETKSTRVTTVALVLAASALAIGGLFCGYLLGLTVATQALPSDDSAQQNTLSDHYRFAHLLIASHYTTALLGGLLGGHIVVLVGRVAAGFLAGASCLFGLALCTGALQETILVTAIIAMICHRPVDQIATKPFSLSSNSKELLDVSDQALCGKEVQYLESSVQENPGRLRFLPSTLPDIHLHVKRDSSEFERTALKRTDPKSMMTGHAVSGHVPEVECQKLQHQVGVLFHSLNQERELAQAAEAAAECEWRRRAEAESQLYHLVRELSRVEAERDSALLTAELLHLNDPDRRDSYESNSLEEWKMSEAGSVSAR